METSLTSFPNGKMVEAMVNTELEALKVHSYRTNLVPMDGDPKRSAFRFIIEVKEKKYSMKINRWELEESHGWTLLSLNLMDLVTDIKHDVKW